MKRLYLLLAMLMLFGMAGCTKSDSELPQTDSSMQQSASSENSHESTQTNSSTEQSAASSEKDHEPPKTNSSIQQSTASSSENTSNHEPPIENTVARPFGEIKIVPESYNSSASRQ